MALGSFTLRAAVLLLAAPLLASDALPVPQQQIPRVAAPSAWSTVPGVPAGTGAAGVGSPVDPSLAALQSQSPFGGSPFPQNTFPGSASPFGTQQFAGTPGSINPINVQGLQQTTPGGIDALRENPLGNGQVPGAPAAVASVGLPGGGLGTQQVGAASPFVGGGFPQSPFPQTQQPAGTFPFNGVGNPTIPQVGSVTPQVASTQAQGTPFGGTGSLGMDGNVGVPGFNNGFNNGINSGFNPQTGLPFNNGVNNQFPFGQQQTFPQSPFGR